MEGAALAGVSAMMGSGDWPAVGGRLGGTSWPAGEGWPVGRGWPAVGDWPAGRVGSGGLGLAAGAVGL